MEILFIRDTKQTAIMGQTNVLVTVYTTSVVLGGALIVAFGTGVEGSALKSIASLHSDTAKSNDFLSMVKRLALIRREKI